MDINSHMKNYIEDIKVNLIEIIVGIKNDYLEKDIYIGFIGYYNFYDNYFTFKCRYYNINFTKNHTYIKILLMVLMLKMGIPLVMKMLP